MPRPKIGDVVTTLSPLRSFDLVPNAENHYQKAIIPPGTRVEILEDRRIIKRDSMWTLTGFLVKTLDAIVDDPATPNRKEKAMAIRAELSDPCE